MFKKFTIFMFVALVSVASLNALAYAGVGGVRISVAAQNVKLALNDVLQLDEPVRRESGVRKTPEAEQQELFTSAWLLGVALSLFVLRASRRKV